MKPAENIKRLIKNLHDTTSAQMDERVLGDVLRALAESEQPSALTWPNIRRTIMKSPITKLAAAAAIAIVVLLPLSYGATKVVRKYFITMESEFEGPEDGTIYRTIQTGVVAGDDIKSEEDAKKVLNKAIEEFGRLYREGKAKEVRPGVWQVILSNGEKFNYGGNPESLGVSETEQKEALKKQFDEIHELKKAGKYEKTYKPEHDYIVNGIKYKYFEARYILSDGTVKTLGNSEPVIEEDERKD